MLPNRSTARVQGASSQAQGGCALDLCWRTSTQCVEGVLRPTRSCGRYTRVAQTRSNVSTWPFCQGERKDVADAHRPDTVVERGAAISCLARTRPHRFNVPFLGQALTYLLRVLLSLARSRHNGFVCWARASSIAESRRRQRLEDGLDGHAETQQVVVTAGHSIDLEPHRQTLTRKARRDG